MNTQILAPIQAYLAARESEFDLIDEARKEILLQLSGYLTDTYQKGQTPQLIVICTHNSRRSHMGQIWLSVGAEYLGLAPLQSFSGGTEATAFNLRSVAALQRTGLEITSANPEAANPLYQITWKKGMDSYTAFSKKFSDSPNPQANFAAIMVCSEADEACPFVPGADFRLALPFDDPKAFDDTEWEAIKYEERSRQIAREILFSLKNVS